MLTSIQLEVLTYLFLVLDNCLLGTLMNLMEPMSILQELKNTFFHKYFQTTVTESDLAVLQQELN